MTRLGSFADLFHRNGASDATAFAEIVSNAMLARSDLFRSMLDPRRDIDAECGYPRSGGGGTGSLDPEFYKSLYEREAVATRVVELFPKECWQVSPNVYEDEDSDKATEFEDAWDELGRGFTGHRSWYRDEVGSPVWEHLRRVDILSGIGHFGIMLIGVDDGRALDQPVDGVAVVDPGESYLGSGVSNSAPSKEVTDDPRTRRPFVDARPIGTDAQYAGVQLGPSEYPAAVPAKAGERRRILFLRSYDETLVQVVQYEANVRNPRFGQPVMYRVTLNDPREMHSGIGLPLATVRVHWSRVLHVADNRKSSEIFGAPRMRPVLNRILDLRKLYSGSAEMYWRGAFPGYTLETVPQLGGDVRLDVDRIRGDMENYMNGLQRYMVLMGMSMKGQAPQVVDPSSQIEVQLAAMCIELGCPVRVFKGSERGELASSQDDASWNDRLRERQNNYITPCLVAPFVDRLVQMGVLPEPDGFSVEWPDLDSLGDQDKATLAVTRTQAATTYASSGGEGVIAPMDFWTRIMGFDEEEAEAIVDAAKENAEENPPPAPVVPPPRGAAAPPAPPKPPAANESLEARLEAYMRGAA